MSTTNWDTIGELLRREGLDHHGFVALERPLSLAVYRDWLDKGYAGEMDYLHRHLPFKEDATLLMKEAKSAIVVAFPYVPHPEANEFPLKSAKVARYAQGEDYHFWIKRKLGAVITVLNKTFPDEGFTAYTDSAPVLERDLAYRAGLGWIGKNTCLIHPKRGSLFLLGEIYTSLPAEASPELLRDFCGTCTRCLGACPTGALVAPRELDATKCISYLTIEAKTLPSEELRAKTAGWFFGCDICQTVCPWNLKVHGKSAFSGSSSGLAAEGLPNDSLISEMRMILTSSNRQIQKNFHGTPLMRAGGFGLKRNALLVSAHFRLVALRPEVESLRTHPKLAPLAEWTLNRWEELTEGDSHSPQDA